MSAADVISHERFQLSQHPPKSKHILVNVPKSMIIYKNAFVLMFLDLRFNARADILVGFAEINNIGSRNRE
mgnify:CR=1 FL=1